MPSHARTRKSDSASSRTWYVSGMHVTIWAAAAVAGAAAGAATSHAQFASVILGDLAANAPRRATLWT
jgi:hypothetical protein